MGDVAPKDPTRFLTTLPHWDAAAFKDVVAAGAGALAAVQAVPHGAPTGRAEEIGAWVAGRWPAVVSALGAWAGAAAQRGGWALVWVYAPGAAPAALGEALAAALRPLAAPALEGRVVAVPVGGVGRAAADAALRATEEDLHRWHHGEPAAERRWSDAPPAGAG